MALKKAKKKKRKGWIRPRHRLVHYLLTPFFRLWVRLKYGAVIEPFPDGARRQYLFISNHQTGFDQFYMSLAAYPRPIYYIASEDLFSRGFLSRLISYLVAPIPFMKSTGDASSMMKCLRVAREGGSIGLFPEGNRTYHGRTVDIKPSIGDLAKALKLPIAVFRFEGGYGVQPRWSDVCRKGGMRVYVRRIIEPAEYANMTGEELYAILKEELTADETKVEGVYPHKKNAEFLERAMYVCPKCGLSTFHSHRDKIWCENCSLTVTHRPDKTLECADPAFPFRYVADWYDYQEKFVRSLNPEDYFTNPLYLDGVSLKQIVPCKKQTRLFKRGSACLWGDTLTLTSRKCTYVFSFDRVRAMCVLGKNKLNVYFDDGFIYQLTGNKRFNALKYMNFYYLYQYKCKEANHAGFLGL